MSRYPGKKIEIWFQDETRFGQKTRLTAVWAESGSRPIVLAQNRFGNAYIFGAVNPESGSKIGLISSHCDSEIMTMHMQEIGNCLSPQSHAIVVMDGAGWHKSEQLKIPDNISICHLPPYCPELNPIERLWLWIKDRYLSHRLFETMDNLIDAGTEAWRNVQSMHVQSICRMSLKCRGTLAAASPN